MISTSIQELFDGTLSDEQTAELLHTLSVSPDKRADFRRHMALQGAMQRDRAASALSSDEDAAIWGALAGLGAASTVGGAAASYAGSVARVLSFVLVGVAGYLLGSNFSTDIFGSGDEAPRTSSSGTVMQRPAASAPATSAPANASATAPANTSANGGTGSGTNNGVQSGASSTTAMGASSAAPKVIYKDRVVYRDRSTATTLAANGSANGASANSSLPTQNQATATATNSGSNGSNGLTTNNGLNANNGANASNSANGTAADPKNTPNNSGGTSTASPAEQKLSDSGQKATEAIAKPEKPRPIDPAQAFRQSPEPVSDMEKKTSLLWKDGFEISVGEYAGMLGGQLRADDMENYDPNYSSRHLDLMYRLFDGRFGFGARFGYGTFSRATFYLDRNVRTEADGQLKSADSMYRVRVQPERQRLLEFVANYRFPILDRMGAGIEGTWGTSALHSEAGGSVLVHWLLTDHLGLQLTGGLNMYWYNYLAEQRQELLKSAKGDVGFSDNALDAYTGTSLELRYGIFYHF